MGAERAGAAYPRRVTPASLRRLPPATAVLLGVLASVVAGLAVLTRDAEVLVHRCVADGTAGTIGLRLALLHHDPACPSGELAVGGQTRQVIGVVVLVALPVLAAHLGGLLAGAGLVARVRAGLRTVRGVLAGLVRPPRPARVPVRGARRVPVEVVRSRHTDPVLATPALRGPPVALA